MEHEQEAQRPRRGDEKAKQWAHELANEFGHAVQFWRQKLDLSASELSNRTREVGYPITRATIAKIESNNRNAKVDIAEVIALAAALRIAPADLIFPGYPDRRQRTTPRSEMTAKEAQAWLSGSEEFEQLISRPGPHNPVIENSQNLRAAVVEFNTYAGNVARALGGRELDTGDIEINGAKEYQREASYRMLKVALSNGHVTPPIWDGRLRDPDADNGEG